MKDLINLVKERKNDILTQLRSEAVNEDMVWDFADDYTYEFQDAMCENLDIEKDKLDEFVGKCEVEINNILFG